MRDVGFDKKSIPEFLRKEQRVSADRRTSAARKNQPIFSGCFQYFPDALAAVAELSKVGNDKHNPGQPLHWSRDKSSDHADCVARHLIDAGPDWTAIDHEDGLLHAQKVAWRALAMLQIAIERIREREPRADVQPVPATTEDGWIVWNGGKCPVAPDMNVEVELRSKDTGVGSAKTWYWKHDGCYSDIVAYRVVKQ